MSVEISAEMLGIDDATKQLDQLIAAESGAEAGTSATKPDGGSASQRATGAEEIESTQGPEPKPTDTPADQAGADTKKPEPGKGQEAKDKQPEAGQEKSRYQKAVERQEKSWKELNEQKEAFKAERAEFERQKAELEKSRQQAQDQFSPEDFEQAAEAFEKEGKLDLAELAREKAEKLRKDPQAKAAREAKTAATAAETQKVEGQRKEWTLKAGIDFPDLVKNGSPLQVRVSQLLKEEPDLKAHPKGVYLASRLASLETSSARVPVMEKELGQLRARVKELEGFTAPGGGGVTALPAQKPFDQQSDTEQLAELERMATEIGPLR